MIKLYYVVEYETTTGEAFYDELTGVKYLTLYTIDNDTPYPLHIAVTQNTRDDKEVLMDWLNSNNYDINTIKLIKL